MTIATPDKKIVSISGDPIITKNTTTKEGVKLTEEEAIARTAAQLPDVKGYRILCMVPQADEAYESGIIKSDAARQIQEHSTVVLWVMQLGGLAYKDEARFPDRSLGVKKETSLSLVLTQELELKFTEKNSALLTTIP
jgi:hypothetical protein